MYIALARFAMILHKVKDAWWFICDDDFWEYKHILHDMSRLSKYYDLHEAQTVQTTLPSNSLKEFSK